jgi:hypothetical protein
MSRSQTHVQQQVQQSQQLLVTRQATLPGFDNPLGKVLATPNIYAMTGWCAVSPACRAADHV